MIAQVVAWARAHRWLVLALLAAAAVIALVGLRGVLAGGALVMAGLGASLARRSPSDPAPHAVEDLERSADELRARDARLAVEQLRARAAEEHARATTQNATAAEVAAVFERDADRRRGLR